MLLLLLLPTDGAGDNGALLLPLSVLIPLSELTKLPPLKLRGGLTGGGGGMFFASALGRLAGAAAASMDCTVCSNL